MKKLLFMLASPLIVVNAQAQTTYPSGVAGCIARWTFDAEDGGLSSILDMSGNGHHGTNNNIVSSAGWKNISNTAGKFNGLSSWSEVMHHSMLNVSNVTMIGLIKLHGFYPGMCEFNQFLSKGYPHFVPGNYGFGVGDVTPCGNLDTNSIRLATQIGNGNQSVPGSNFVHTNKWYFFASTIGNNEMRQYQIEMNPSVKASSINPISSFNIPANIGVNSASISLGKHLNPNYPYWTNADMDELILFNKELTSSEIYSVYEFLYGGNPNSVASIENSHVEVKMLDGTLEIESLIENFDIEVLNSLGQIVISKNDCHLTEKVNLNNVSKQILLVKITDKKTKRSIVKKVMN